MAAPRRRCDSQQALPDEIILEIFLRFPLDEPVCLLRASLASKRLHRAVSEPFFRRRLHELHRTPPVLGFLHNRYDEDIPRFVHSTASAFPLAAPDDHPCWEVVVDCRHGRALFLINREVATELLIWEPITGAQHRVPVPAAFENLCPTAAVFCPVEGCSHYNCHGGPFRVVFVFAVDDDDEDKFFTSASVYSSETGTWGEVTRIHDRATCFSSSYRSSVLVRRSLFYFMPDGADIVEYDLDSHDLAPLDSPDPNVVDTFSLMLAEDGGLGVCEVLDPQQLMLWSWEESDDNDDDDDGQWVLSRVIYLDNLRPNGALSGVGARALFFAEGANVIFVTTDDGIFTIELQSERVKKVCDHHFLSLVPVVSFYTPMPLLNLSEEAGGEEGGVEEEKTVEQAHQLFGKGTNAVKEGDFDHSFISHDLMTRVPGYGKVDPQGASTSDKYECALLSEAQEVNDPLGDVPKIVPNEESVKGTSSKDDSGNSKISGSNIMVAAPPSEKDDSEEGIVYHGPFPRSMAIPGSYHGVVNT